MAKKILSLILTVIFISGCATYRFAPGKKPYDKGYVATYDNYPIPEYTIGKDNAVPAELDLAKKRFKRRRGTVEYYYKKMGRIRSRMMDYTEFPLLFAKLIVGQVRIPFVAYSDYKYDHDPKYREKIDSRDRGIEEKEETRVTALQKKLNFYIQKDLAKEEGIALPVIEPAPKAAEAMPEAVRPAPQKKESFLKGLFAKKPPKERPAPKKKEAKVRKERVVTPKKEMVTAESVPSDIQAVIVAKPAKGYSPLTVHFSAGKSHSRGARIISYSWDFGDGDISYKANPVNTFYSGSFEPKNFTVTLTVYDSKGNNATASAVIEVANK